MSMLVGCNAVCEDHGGPVLVVLGASPLGRTPEEAPLLCASLGEGR